MSNEEEQKFVGFKMIEIYEGRDKQWKGWHNFILDSGRGAGEDIPIAGPLNPPTSKAIKGVLDRLAEITVEEAKASKQEKE